MSKWKVVEQTHDGFTERRYVLYRKGALGRWKMVDRFNKEAAAFILENLDETGEPYRIIYPRKS